MKIRFTRNAYSDIDAVYNFIAKDNPVAAQRVLDRVESMIDHLIEHPNLGLEGRVNYTRELIVPDTPYIVAYELNQEFIDILAIIHSSRRWPDSFSELPRPKPDVFLKK